MIIEIKYSLFRSLFSISYILRGKRKESINLVWNCLAHKIFIWFTFHEDICNKMNALLHIYVEKRERELKTNNGIKF